jgi:hypothetical protein
MLGQEIPIENFKGVHDHVRRKPPLDILYAWRNDSETRARDSVDGCSRLTTKPFTPVSTISGTLPEQSQLSVPQAMASIITMPNGFSHSMGIRRADAFRAARSLCVVHRSEVSDSTSVNGGAISSSKYDASGPERRRSWQ